MEVESERETHPNKGIETYQAKADERRQTIWQFIAERTIEGGEPVRSSDILQNLGILSTTYNEDIKILLEAGEVKNVGTPRLPRYLWTGLDQEE